MTVLLPFLVNAVLNFALGLLIALFLGPEAFGLYAIGAALVVLVNTAALDWLKLSAVRFYTAQTRASDPGIRSTLDLLFAAAALALSGNTIPRDIAVEKLQQRLKDEGAFIGRDQKVPEGL